MCLRKVFLYIHLSSGSTFLLDSSMLYTKFGKLLAIISSNIFMPLSHHSFHDCKKLCIRLLHSSLSFAHFSSIFFLSVLCKGSFLQSHQVCCCCCFFFFLTISTIFQTTQQNFTVTVLSGLRRRFFSF